MKPSDLVRDFGNPVAYYPGLVKHLGSVNAVVLFCQLFYWTGKEASELGIFKTTEDIERETGLTYEEQLTARKKLKRRGILHETNKRLEHRIYYRIDTNRLDEVMTQAIEIAPHGQNPIRETANANSANKGNPERPARESQPRREGVPGFVHTEITTENTAETFSGAEKSAPAAGGSGVPAVLPEGQQVEQEETAFQVKCKACWIAYGTAYTERYATAPIRNAKVNAQVKQLVQRLGEEAAAVADFFVRSINEAYVVRNCHELGALVAKAEAYRTQWATGRAMTAGQARQIDSTQTNANAADQAKAMLRARREKGQGQ